MATAPPPSTQHIPTLEVGNFERWRPLITTYIKGRGYGSYLAGEEEEPKEKEKDETDRAFRLRKREFETGHAFILNAMHATIDDTNRTLILDIEYGHLAMQKLREHHGQAKLSTITGYLIEFVTTVATEETDMAKHMGRMRELQGRLAATAAPKSKVDSTAVSTVSAASSSAQTLDISLSDGVISAIILNSLPPSYNILADTFFHGAVCDFTSSNVFSRVQQEIARRGQQPLVEKKTVTGLAAGTEGVSKSDGGGKAKRQGFGGNSKSGADVVCGYEGCKKKGHSTETCRRRKLDAYEGAVKAGLIADDHSKSPEVPAAIARTASLPPDFYIDSPFVRGFSAVVTTSIPANAASIPRSSAYLDSAAGDHLWMNADDLSDLHDVPPVAVILANGTKLIAHQAGNLSLQGESGPFGLSRALLVPGLAHNLVSVHRIASSKRFVVVFDEIGGSVRSKESGTVVVRALPIGSVYVINDAA